MEAMLTVDTASGFFSRIKLDTNPIAHPASRVICGKARFTVLTSRLIRMEWSSAQAFEDRPTFAFPNRHAQPPAFSCEENGTTFELKTDDLTLHFTDNGKPFNPTNLSVTFHLNEQAESWWPGRVNTANLRGTCRTLDQCPDAVSLQ